MVPRDQHRWDRHALERGRSRVLRVLQQALREGLLDRGRLLDRPRYQADDRVDDHQGRELAAREARCAQIEHDTAETVAAAQLGAPITVIFINNAIYGMTGGQMAPTTLPGMKTTSSPNGRDVETQGYPIRMAEMLANVQAPVGGLVINDKSGRGMSYGGYGYGYGSEKQTA